MQGWRDADRAFSSQRFNTPIEFLKRKERIVLHIANRRIWPFFGAIHM